jgi:hypothetical protein
MERGCVRQLVTTIYGKVVEGVLHHVGYSDLDWTLIPSFIYTPQSRGSGECNGQTCHITCKGN